MPFDARPRSESERSTPAIVDEPIDWVDWGMRIAVFAPLLMLYLYWIWTIVRTAVQAFAATW